MSAQLQCTAAESATSPGVAHQRLSAAVLRKREYHKIWTSKPENKRRINAANKRYRDSHPESRRERRVKNKIKENEWNRQRRKTKAFHISGVRRKQRLRNPEKFRNQHRDWNARNPLKAACIAIRSAARRRAAKAKVVIGDPKPIRDYLLKLKSGKTFRCYYCEQTFPVSELTIDHVVSIHRKGPHDIANLAAACGTCNRQKSDTSISEWWKPGQQILDL